MPTRQLKDRDAKLVGELPISLRRRGLEPSPGHLETLLPLFLLITPFLHMVLALFVLEAFRTAKLMLPPVLCASAVWAALPA